MAESCQQVALFALSGAKHYEQNQSPFVLVRDASPRAVSAVVLLYDHTTDWCTYYCTVGRHVLSPVATPLLGLLC